MSRKQYHDDDSVSGPGAGRVVLQILIALGIILVFFVLSQIIAGMRAEPEIKKRGNPTLAVMATKAVADDVQLLVTVQGETRPRTEIDLVPEVGGKITYVSPKFLTGGLFKKNDVLYRIEEADYRVAVVRAESAVARAQQLIVRERAESQIAQQDWEELGDGPASDLTLRKPQLLEAQANLQSAESDLDNAKLRLARTAVRAPFNGRVRDKFADIGQFVNPGSRLGRIFSTDVAEVRLALSDNDLSKLDIPVAYVAASREEAPKVRITTVIGGKLREWNGHIMRTDSTFDISTRTLFAIAEVVDPYGVGATDANVPLAPGMYVDAHITGKTLKNVISIPRGGLRPENKVYVVDDKGIATSNDVVVLDTNRDRAALLSGINVGDLVILSALERSQISLTFKVLDVNNPDIVLVDPAPKGGDDKDKEKSPAKTIELAKKKIAEASEKIAAQQKKIKEAKAEIKKAKRELKKAKK